MKISVKVFFLLKLVQLERNKSRFRGTPPTVSFVQCKKGFQFQTNRLLSSVWFINQVLLTFNKWNGDLRSLRNIRTSTFQLVGNNDRCSLPTIVFFYIYHPAGYGSAKSLRIPIYRGVHRFISRLVNSFFLCSTLGIYMSPLWGFRVFVYLGTIDMAPLWG